MKEDQLFRMFLMKSQVKMALDVFHSKFKKTPKGIQKIYENLILSEDIGDIKNGYAKFFGYLKKSKNAKEKWEEFEKEMRLPP